MTWKLIAWRQTDFRLFARCLHVLLWPALSFWAEINLFACNKRSPAFLISSFVILLGMQLKRVARKCAWKSILSVVWNVSTAMKRFISIFAIFLHNFSSHTFVQRELRTSWNRIRVNSIFNCDKKRWVIQILKDNALKKKFYGFAVIEMMFIGFFLLDLVGFSNILSWFTLSSMRLFIRYVLNFECGDFLKTNLDTVFQYLTEHNFSSKKFQKCQFK